MVKKYDLVRTDKLSAEYDGSLLEVEMKAAADLENGRLVIEDANGDVAYCDDNTKEVMLHASVEKMYDNASLTNFIQAQGNEVRAIRLQNGDIFSTTAYVGTPAKGDILCAENTTGKLKAKGVDTPANEFKVIALETFGYLPVVVVKKIK